VFCVLLFCLFISFFIIWILFILIGNSIVLYHPPLYASVSLVQLDSYLHSQFPKGIRSRSIFIQWLFEIRIALVRIGLVEGLPYSKSSISYRTIPIRLKPHFFSRLRIPVVCPSLYSN
jgi:hypothetical protein